MPDKKQWQDQEVSVALELLISTLADERKRIYDVGANAMKAQDGDTALAVINFAKNLHDFYGYDIRRLIHPMKMTMLNTYGKWGFYFMQYFPILLAFPASLSFLKDKDNGAEVYLRSKFGNRNYYYGKIIAVFIMTFIAFAFPLFFEYMLNIIT